MKYLPSKEWRSRIDSQRLAWTESIKTHQSPFHKHSNPSTWRNFPAAAIDWNSQRRSKCFRTDSAASWPLAERRPTFRPSSPADSYRKSASTHLPRRPCICLAEATAALAHPGAPCTHKSSHSVPIDNAVSRPWHGGCFGLDLPAAKRQSARCHFQSRTQRSHCLTVWQSLVDSLFLAASDSGIRFQQTA